MNTTALTRLGLHPNDQRVFAAIATLGKTKTGAIMQSSGVGSSQTYLSLGRLIKRGLVSYQVRNNVRYYQAELPDSLLEEARKNVSELEHLSEELVRTPFVAERNVVNTFETKAGLKKALLRHVDQLERKETISIVGYSSRVPDRRELRLFLRRCNELAEAKKCSMRMILDSKFRGSLGERVGPLYKIRFLPTQYFTPAAQNICKREVLLSVWGAHPLAISISEPAAIASFQKNFDFLWDIAKK